MQTFNKTDIVLNGICPYYTMFPLDFPLNILSKGSRAQWVLDPFCGRGTTNFAARLHGINSIGIDSNKMAAAIADSKFCHTNSLLINELAENILHHKSIPSDVPQGEFWQWAYDDKTLSEICVFREYFTEKANLDNTDKALRAIIMGILHGPILKTVKNYLSNQMPKTYATKPDYSVRYWKNRQLKPFYVNSIDAIRRKAQHFFDNSIPSLVEGEIINADSRTVNFSQLGKKFDWIITSPPYYGMDSYEQDQWLRNWFLGGSDQVTYSRRSQLKHHTEEAFVNELGTIWHNVSYACNDRARLIIRFGAIPSRMKSLPEDLLIRSIEKVPNSNWEIKEIVPAGQPIYYRRQALQFKKKTGNYIEEFDLYATLK